MHEHNGTHVDAPAHFLSNAKPNAHVTIERVPLTQLLGRGVRLDCRGTKAGEYVSKSQIEDWEGRHGPLQAGDIVLFDFGWAGKWGLRPNDQALRRRLAGSRHGRGGVPPIETGRRHRRGHTLT